ncbi:putative g2 m phase checkpoint control protein [Diaporthe ampelina]|uniref:Putative g2 m phase checkpoint control protein n=1 Tax=Diaporthe ampelina TaxID=1214573 RepID=A0A0G2HNK7_9PEZI|nr:putative g2 m phase checkpoint control protein [Diaporthe ampelina]
MSDFLGARISLISKSDIRYVGTLYEINSNESTVSLENVRSHGSEGRKGDPSEEVSASDQVYDFIVFRGSDVKDLRIEEGPAAPKENQPPMPNDPAIVGGHDEIFRMLVLIQGGHLAPTNLLARTVLPAHLAHLDSKTPICFLLTHLHKAGVDLDLDPLLDLVDMAWDTLLRDGSHLVKLSRRTGRVHGTTIPSLLARQVALQVLPACSSKGSSKGSNKGSSKGSSGRHQESPTPPMASKPSAEEVKVTAALLENQKPGAPSAPGKQIPTGPKGLTKITPAVPLPAALTARATQSTVAASANVNNASTNSAAALRDATEAARAAVAVAMAKLEQPGGSAGLPAHPANSNGVDNLTNKVNEMRVSSGRSGVQNGRGRGRGGARHTKVDVPDSDFDFATANAKFNKEDVVKERIAGSPITETPVDAASDGQTGAAAEPKEVYDKAKSFFDNISSEAKDRKSNNGQRPGGREWRAEEQHRNIETFGQGSVDGGYRGYRGRGRGRGGRGRGYGGRGRGAYRGPRSDAQTVPQ